MLQTFQGVLALDHTAIAVRTIESVLPFYRDLLGGSVVLQSTPAGKGYHFLQLEYPNGSKVELLEPVGTEGFLHDFLAKRGEGVHHLTYIVRDLKEAVEAARAAGYRVVGESYANPKWQEAFISPRDLHGTLIQLAAKAGDDEEPAAVPGCPTLA
jgi:methylmalonyl-CoA/ethylmalonyl-CoA epimerase